MRIASVVLLLLLSGVAPATAGNSLTETFDTNTLRDSSATTAHWDTTSGTLGLPAFAPSRLGTAPTGDFAMNVTVAGDVAYISANQAGMWLFDVGDPGNPAFIDSILTTEQIREIEVRNGLAFMANNFAGLFVVDVSNPAAPTKVSNLVTTGQTVSIDVAGDYAYLGDGPAGVTVLDISDPALPTVAATLFGIGYVQHVRVAGNYLFAAAWFNGLQVVDITDPTNPVLVTGINTAGWSRAIAIAGDVLYLGDSLEGVHIVDIADPTAPTIIHTIDTPGLARGVDIDGSFLYVADHFDGMHVYDVSIPTAPVHFGTTLEAELCHWVDVHGAFAYVADGPNGLRTFSAAMDVSPPQFTAVGGAQGMFSGDATVSGDVLFVAAGASGANAFSIGDPFAPVLINQFGSPGADARDVAVDGASVFVVSGASPGLEIFDVSDLSAPISVGSLPFAIGCVSVEVDGDWAIVAGNGSRLFVVDISDLSAPVAVGSVTVVSPLADVVVDGTRVFAVDAFSRGFSVVDVSDRTAPVVIAQYSGGGGTGASMTLHGSVAYLLGGLSGGIDVIDISNPIAPIHVTTLNVTGGAFDMQIAGDAAFVAGATGGLHVVDVTDPLAPVLLPGHASSGDLRTLAHAGDYVFATGNGMGLESVRVFQRFLDTTHNVAQSKTLNAPTGAGPIVRAQLDAIATGDADWQMSVDGGQSWQSVVPAGGWTTLDGYAADARWRAELLHTMSQPNTLPVVDEVTVTWLYESPLITSIEDVPADQGGMVTVDFARSGHEFIDSPTPVVSYTVYRLDTTFAWDSLTTIAAAGLDTYQVTAPTWADSTREGGAVHTVFRVVARAAAGEVFGSPPDSGCSVDNLPPAPPQNAEIAYGDKVFLSWGSPPDPDLLYFNVYRDVAPGFTPGPDNLVHSIDGTSWGDPDGGPLHFYKLTALDAARESAPVSPQVVTGVRDVGVPTRFALHQNVPNPFNPSTTIRFDVPGQGARVSVDIFNVRGQLVRRLVSRAVDAGVASVTWDGRDDGGRRVASGVYFYRLSAPGFSATRKMVLVE